MKNFRNFGTKQKADIFESYFSETPDVLLESGREAEEAKVSNETT